MSRILVVSGSTEVPIDRVRVISNRFGGRTGSSIAVHLANSGHEVTLLTSDRRAMVEVGECEKRIELDGFATYDDLMGEMERIIHSSCPPEVVIQAAAVSDYCSGGLCLFKDGRMVSLDHSGKVSSNQTELWLRMVPTLKIIDMIHAEWGFQGKLVKFKLEVGVSDEELIRIATESMHRSKADMIVANCREWMSWWAIVITADGKVRKVRRSKLPEEIERRLELCA